MSAEKWIEDMEGRIHAVAVKNGVVLREPVVRDMALYLHQGLGDAPINRLAVTNLLARAHAALRTVDCNLYLDGPSAAEAVHGTALRVTDAINAIEEFARERGIVLEG